MNVDLHMHTNCSDGMYSPEELTAMAVNAKIQVMAISDHDTVDAYTNSHSFASGVRVIPAIEMSSEYEGEDVHILGYYIQTDQSDLQAYCTQFKKRRKLRAMEMVEKCQHLGYTIDTEAIEAVFKKGGTIGRPHIARMLVQKGYFSTVRDVFDKLLYRSGPAYVPYQRNTIEECIQIIHQAGGLAILAHPGLIHHGLDAILQRPFDGLEVYHPQNKEHWPMYLQLAEQRHWYISGGSDFHGVKGRFPEQVGLYTVDSKNVESLITYAKR